MLGAGIVAPGPLLILVRFFSKEHLNVSRALGEGWIEEVAAESSHLSKMCAKNRRASCFIKSC